jgi:16S rRNA processing protein RimM
MNEGALHTSPGRLVPVGEIVGTHGVAGLLRLHPHSPGSAPLADGSTVLLTQRDGGDPRPIELVSARPHGRVVLLRVAGVDSIEAAEPLIGSVLAVPEADLPPAGNGEYYAYQLVGLAVVTSAGDPVGTVESSFATGANEVLVVRDGTREHLIPLIADVVRGVDLAGRRLVIEPVEGLLE